MRFLVLLAALLSPAAIAADCTVRSGTGTNALVELYTSEGCSSCPPADRWLASLLKADPRIVPIAFHVSYWDYIGWKDLFADERFTQRQKDLAKAQGASSVYTPQVVLGGHDYRSWHNGPKANEAIEVVKQRPIGARIEIAPRVARDGGVEGIVRAEVFAGSKPGDLALIVAITQSGLSSRVTAGENRGEKLDHNFVAREMAVIRVSENKVPPSMRGTFSFKPKPGWNLDKMAVVAFVQNLRNGQVLQALSAPICRE